MCGSKNSGGKEAPIPAGKVPPDLLARLLSMPRLTSGDIIVGPRLGEDAAVVNLQAGALVVTSDPITFRTPKPGWYAVHVNANDLAVTGARPLFFTLTIIMPPGTKPSSIETLMAETIQAADALGAVLIGGHSEISEAVRQPVISVTMLGRLIGSKPVGTGDGRPGDAVIQVNPMAVEGTSILAAEHREALQTEFGRELVDRAGDFLNHPGLSVAVPARLAVENLPVGAMHDPTEGGLATGLREMAEASGCGLTVWKENLLLAEETEKICRFLGFDPLGLISSGCLIFTVPGGRAEEAVSLMAGAGLAAVQIGELTDRPGDLAMVDEAGKREAWPIFGADELTQA